MVMIDLVYNAQFIISLGLTIISYNDWKITISTATRPHYLLPICGIRQTGITARRGRRPTSNFRHYQIPHEMVV